MADTEAGERRIRSGADTQRGSPPGALARRERRLVWAGLLMIALLCWLYIAPAAVDMYGPMTGVSAWMMQASWDLRYTSLIFGMWAVMMVGMMLPSAMPAILLFERMSRAGGGPALAPVSAFTGGYLAAWFVFSLAATLLQRELAALRWLTPMMESGNALFGGGLLLFAGVYQLTAFKRACLARCRSPLQFFATRWRRGTAGALRMGVEHGMYCLGCCAGLMLLLFVGGVMNLWWIVGLTAFVLFEKLAPAGLQGGRFSGIALIAAAAVTLLWP